VRRGLWVGLIAAALVTICAATAGAHRVSYPSVIGQETAPPSPRPDFKVTGHLASLKDACIRNRTVKFLARTEDGSKVVLDKDRTNDRGRWVLIGDVTTTVGERIKATRKRLPKRHGHRRVCEAAKAPLLF
jgi:hypothetical protein